MSARSSEEGKVVEREKKDQAAADRYINKFSFDIYIERERGERRRYKEDIIFLLNSD